LFIKILLDQDQVRGGAAAVGREPAEIYSVRHGVTLLVLAVPGERVVAGLSPRPDQVLDDPAGSVVDRKLDRRRMVQVEADRCRAAEFRLSVFG
jgi:hypothetical protein